MAERVKGTVKWFNVTKGFGFITPDDGSEDLFFRQFIINSDGSIIQNGAVEFTVGTGTGNDGRARAYDVATPGGDALSGSSRPGDDHGVRGYGGGYGGDCGGHACYKCGEENHIFRSCTRGGYVGSGGCYDGRVCRKCGEEGHISRYCPQSINSYYHRVGRYDGGGGDHVCYKCGAEGHISRHCPNGSRGHYNGGGGHWCYNNGEKWCFSCAEFGHIPRDCTNNASIRPVRSGCPSLPPLLSL